MSIGRGGCKPFLVHCLSDSFLVVFLSRADISNFRYLELRPTVPGRGLVSVYHCNFTLDILNPGYLELRPAVPGRGLVSVYHFNFILDISNLGRVPGRGLVSGYHCNFTLDITVPLEF